MQLKTIQIFYTFFVKVITFTKLKLIHDYIMSPLCVFQGLDTEWEETPNEVEMDLWEDSRLQCLDHLTEWDKLQTCVTEEGTGDIWQDNFYMVSMILSVKKM